MTIGPYLQAFAIVGVATVVITPIIMPKLVLSLPPEYFTDPKQIVSRHPVMKLARNVLGGLLFVLGIALLFLPGQGILTILAAAIICEFPKKKKFLYWAVKKLHMQNRLNHFREKHGRQPFEWPIPKPKLLPSAAKTPN